eukprot:3191361-Rhodomonas_salina.7
MKPMITQVVNSDWNSTACISTQHRAPHRWVDRTCSSAVIGVSAAMLGTMALAENQSAIPATWQWRELCQYRTQHCSWNEEATSQLPRIAIDFHFWLVSGAVVSGLLGPSAPSSWSTVWPSPCSSPPRHANVANGVSPFVSLGTEVQRSFRLPTKSCRLSSKSELLLSTDRAEDKIVARRGSVAQKKYPGTDEEGWKRAKWGNYGYSSNMTVSEVQSKHDQLENASKIGVFCSAFPLAKLERLHL